MSLCQPHTFEIPEETARVAKAAFPKGNVYLTMRDELGPIFSDDDFAALFSRQGQDCQSPGIVAMVTVMQYMEDLTDRQAAAAVRSRIDWKYLLGLPLTDSGFHYSILSPYRTKRKTNWTGYAVHLTEIRSSEGPNMITHIETTPATTTDGTVLDTIHQNLADKDLPPEEHFLDAGYVSVDNLVDAQDEHNVDLIGSVGGGSSWQAKEGKGFDVSCFAIDWENQTVTCPQCYQIICHHLVD